MSETLSWRVYAKRCYNLDTIWQRREICFHPTRIICKPVIRRCKLLSGNGLVFRSSHLNTRIRAQVCAPGHGVRQISGKRYSIFTSSFSPFRNLGSSCEEPSSFVWVRGPTLLVACLRVGSRWWIPGKNLGSIPPTSSCRSWGIVSSNHLGRRMGRPRKYD